MIRPPSSLTVSTLTPPGVGAMAVIRIAGTDAHSVLRRIFQPHSGHWPAEVDPQRLMYGRLVDRGDTIDDAIVVVSGHRADRHIVDMTVHGGVRVVERITMLLRQLGVVIQATDPPTDGDTSVFEAEVLAALARAKTKRAVRFLAFQRRALPQALESIARTCDTDEAKGRAMMTDLLERSRPGRYLMDGATVAVLGPVNAGKSTLVNRMFAGARSLVSPQAGTTRDWVDTTTAIGGVPVRVIDTAGARHDAESLERLAIERGIAQSAEADVQIVVIDGSAPFPSAFLERYRSTIDPGRAVVAVNKSDLPPAWDLSKAGRLAVPVVPTSALTGRGTPELTRIVLDVLSIAVSDPDKPCLFTMRQRDWISRLLSGHTERCSSQAIRAAIRSAFYW